MVCRTLNALVRKYSLHEDWNSAKGMTLLLMIHIWCLVLVSEIYEYVQLHYTLYHIRNDFLTYMCLFITKLRSFLFWNIVRMADQIDPSLYVQLQNKQLLEPSISVSCILCHCRIFLTSLQLLLRHKWSFI